MTLELNVKANNWQMTSIAVEFILNDWSKGWKLNRSSLIVLAMKEEMHLQLKTRSDKARAKSKSNCNLCWAICSEFFQNFANNWCNRCSCSCWNFNFSLHYRLSYSNILLLIGTWCTCFISQNVWTCFPNHLEFWQGHFYWIIRNIFFSWSDRTDRTIDEVMEILFTIELEILYFAFQDTDCEARLCFWPAINSSPPTRSVLFSV